MGSFLIKLIIMIYTKTYNNVPKKREVQKYLLSYVNAKDSGGKIICLGGNTIDPYIDLLHEHKFKFIKVVESDVSVLVNQIKYRRANMSFVRGDINDYLDQHDHFYDLDYMCSIAKIGPSLEKIFQIPQFMLTVALRPFTKEYTLNLLNSYSSNFIYRTYRDSGTAMLTILKQ
jgi:hypothetical protein